MDKERPKMKTLQTVFTPLLDYLISHCTGLCLAYSKISFAIMRKDKRLASLKGAYTGKRCFIVALGPSLTTDDLDKIAEHGEYCFSMNRCYQLFDKTKWRPNCYFISDGRVATQEVREAINKMMKAGIDVIYSKREVKHLPSEAIFYKADYIDFILTHSNNPKYNNQGYIGRFSTDAFDRVYSAHSCVTSILQVAYYMGFKEICFIGQDCGVSNKKSHSEGIKAPINPHQADDLKRVLNDFDKINQDIKEKQLDLKIYNCTRGGNLEVFPRRELEEVLADPC